MNLPRFVYSNEYWKTTTIQLSERIQYLKNEDPLCLLSGEYRIDSDFNINLWLPHLSSDIQFWIDVEEDEYKYGTLYPYISKIYVFNVTYSYDYVTMLEISNHHNPGYPISIRPRSSQYRQKLELIFDVLSKLKLVQDISN